MAIETWSILRCLYPLLFTLKSSPAPATLAFGYSHSCWSEVPYWIPLLLNIINAVLFIFMELLAIYNMYVYICMCALRFLVSESGSYEEANQPQTHDPLLPEVLPKCCHYRHG